MTSPNSYHPDRHPVPNSDLHPLASNQEPLPCHPPEQPPETKSLSSPSNSPQTPPLHLPSSRQFLTSLITAISNIPLLDEPPTQPRHIPGPPQSHASETKTAETRKQLLQILKDEGEGGQESKPNVKGKKTGEQVNPLKLVPPEYRHLIITLHVLFPGVVLPALEVLERGLVEQVILRSSPDSSREKVKEEEEEQENVVMGEHDEDDRVDDRDHGDRDKSGKAKQKEQSTRTAAFYLVRSSQFLNNAHFKRKRKSNMGFGDATDMQGTARGEVDQNRIQIQRYLVSLEAWNCTCAAFAFAFACVSELENDDAVSALAAGEGAATGAGAGRKENEGLQGSRRERDKPGSAGWTFGGMTLFDVGDHSSVPPVCKHLLSCLLADKWKGALGRYVRERVVSKEEMAGVVADV